MAKTPGSRQGSRESADEHAAFYAGLQPLTPPKEAQWQGKRVVLVGDHPWSGYTGTVEGKEVLLAREALKVKLENGSSCYVFDPAQIRSVDVGD